MIDCDWIRLNTSLYLDCELKPSDTLAFREHLGSCAKCGPAVGSERKFLDSIQTAAPLRQAPAELREAVEKMILGREGLGQDSGVRRVPLSVTASRRTVAALLTAVTVALAGLGFWYFKNRPATAGSASLGFAALAVSIHQRHMAGRLALEMVSDSPDAVARWFGDRAGFRLKLPNYQASSGQERIYTIEGGRLVDFNNGRAAYVSYKLGTQLITLLVAPDSLARPAGGEEIISKGIVFHFDSTSGLKVITWSDRGLTYALVSNLREKGQQSCLVCHQGTRDQDFLQGFDRTASPLANARPAGPAGAHN